MQSYQLHITSEHLKRRHPYLEPPFKARYDPSQIHKSVFDRAIPKLIEILLIEDLPSNRYTSALITLNEIGSDDAQKNNMINQGAVGIAGAYLHCQKVVSIRRQATLLLGLLLSTPSGLQKMSIEEIFSGLKKLLFDDQLEVRNAVGWAIYRIVLSRAGVDILCKNGITPFIIQSFLKYSGLQKKEQQYFCIYILEAFQHLLSFDDGIKSCIGTGLTKRLKQLTQTKDIYSESNNPIIHSLALRNLSNLAMNSQGKQQCVIEEVIGSAQQFLTSQNAQQVANAVTLIMFTAINLKGKKQCIYNSEGKVNSKIVINLIKLLGPIKTPVKQDQKIPCEIGETVKGDIKQALKIISQQQDGFSVISEFMSRQANITHINDIFGSNIIIPLAKLLPKVTDISEPPTLPSNKVNDYKAYAKTICYFIVNVPEAVEIGLNQCVDLVTKLAFFICYRGDKVLQEGITKSMEKLASNHEYSRKILKEVFTKYGDIQHRISKTTLNNQLKYFSELKKIVEQ